MGECYEGCETIDCPAMFLHKKTQLLHACSFADTNEDGTDAYVLQLRPARTFSLIGDGRQSTAALEIELESQAASCA